MHFIHCQLAYTYTLLCLLIFSKPTQTNRTNGLGKQGARKNTERDKQILVDNILTSIQTIGNFRDTLYNVPFLLWFVYLTWKLAFKT